MMILDTSIILKIFSFQLFKAFDSTLDFTSSVVKDIMQLRYR